MKQTFVVGIETSHNNFNDWMTEHDTKIKNGGTLK